VDVCVSNCQFSRRIQDWATLHGARRLIPNLVPCRPLGRDRVLNILREAWHSCGYGFRRTHINASSSAVLEGDWECATHKLGSTATSATRVASLARIPIARQC
jgi:hypothetical protein